jgi:hypothetical protein
MGVQGLHSRTVRVIARPDSSLSSYHSGVYHSVLSSQECAYSSSLTDDEDGVCWGALVIGSISSYADLKMYHLIPDQLTELYKQKDSANKIKTRT